MNHHAENMILMTPGPVNVPDIILEELSKPLIFHRYKEFQTLYENLTKKLHKSFCASIEHKCVIFTGSGTLANEIILSSVFDENDKVLVISNGEFGERLAAILKIHKIPIVHYKLNFLEKIEPFEVIRKAVMEKVTGVAMVAMETSSGMVNPVKEIGVLLNQNSSQPVAFFVDAISAFGCEPINVQDWSISYCTAVPNKALEGPPGISFACINTSHYFARKRFSKSFYLDLSKYLEFSELRQTPTTPSIPLFKSLLKALEIFEDEKVSNRRVRYQSLTNYLIEKMQDVNFIPLINDKNNRSSAVTAFAIPMIIDDLQLKNTLLDQGFVLWFPQQQLLSDKRKLMLASVMGSISKHHIDSVSDIIASLVN